MFENLGKALGLLRELRGLSQAKTAKAAGIGKSQLSKYENSKELPKLDSLEKLLKVLGVGYFEFFYTLRFVDDRATSRGSVHQIPMLPPEAHGSILHPTTQAIFQTVFADFFKLYSRVVEEVLLGRLDERTPRGRRYLLDVGTEDDG